LINKYNLIVLSSGRYFYRYNDYRST